MHPSSNHTLHNCRMNKTKTPQGDGNKLSSCLYSIEPSSIKKRKTPRGDGNFSIDFSVSSTCLTVSSMKKRKTPKGDGNCSQLWPSIVRCLVSLMKKRKTPRGDGNLPSIRLSNLSFFLT